MPDDDYMNEDHFNHENVSFFLLCLIIQQMKMVLWEACFDALIG